MALGVSIIGLQWGDEAKGKLVDLMSPQFDLIVRYQGGANAGHTVVIGGQTYKLHHLPSGILHPGVINVVTAGVVVEPITLLREIDSLKERGVDVTGRNLLLSDRANVVFPWHIAEDMLLNSGKMTGGSIGTTNRGIGPTYRDKVGRIDAVRLGDMYRPDFTAKLNEIIERKNALLSALDPHFTPLIADDVYKEYQGYAERLQPYVAETTQYLLDACEAGRKLLFEGAQGAMLDVDHGTYPYVTSSNSSGVGVSAGSGVPGRWIGKVIGVAKCYTSWATNSAPPPAARGAAVGSTRWRPATPRGCPASMASR
jgi:adenylosuccinate synthase